MFDGLTSFHPLTGEPVAALASHYEVSADKLRYTFWLLGHPAPGGTSFSAQAGRRIRAARWSDGTPITAHDFVYSWRRAVDPATAAFYAYQFHYIANGAAISKGNAAPETLSVRALDDFSLEVQLEHPTPFFLRLTADRRFFATPRQVIEGARRRSAEDSWTHAENIVTSGAFTLREWRPHERIVLVKSNRYYDSHAVSLDEILFVPVTEGSTSANLYRSGEAAFTMPMIPDLVVGRDRKKDVRTYADFGAHLPAMNTTKPPFDDVRVRYAFNMAVDKDAIASFYGDGRAPLKGIVPPLKGYAPPTTLPLVIDGTSFDVLSYNPEAARALLANSRYARGLSTEYLFPTMSEFRNAAEVLQQQWLQNLGVEVRLVCQEVQTWIQRVSNIAYSGIAAWGDTDVLEDPTSFLDMFTSMTKASGSGWSDSEYDALLAGSKATADPKARMRKLAECERFILRAMPCMPLYSDVHVYLCKPYVKGLVGDPFHGRMFNDIRIDTNWRPQ
jgi:ABC-type oligopeptide transport system substrate-binding subunit